MRDVRRMHEKLELRLDRMQLVYLSLGGVLALAVAFTLGLVVGRRAARLESEPPPSLAAVEAEAQMRDELTFYQRLTEPVPTPSPVPAHTPEPEARALPPSPSPQREAVREPAKQPSDSAEPALVASPAASPAAPTPAVEAESGAGLLGELAKGPARSGEYTVQVSAFRTQAEARAYASALERKGFKPFVVSSDVGGKGMWYRVRIGSFTDEAGAQKAKSYLARADIPAWVLRSE